MKRVMIIAGGPWQVPLVQTARRLDHYVICTNLHADSPAFEFSQTYEVGDVLDRERQLEFARKHKVDAVITDQSDIAVPSVAYVCEQLGLPGIGIDKALLFTNKFRMREFALAHGDPTPAFTLCTDVEQACRFSIQSGYPLVLKPVASQASRGVFKVESETEMRALFPVSIKLSTSGEVIVEQFIIGSELTVEGYVMNGRHQTLAISRKRHLASNPMVACELYYSPDDPEIDYAVLRVQHDRLVSAMELPFGITHAEYLHMDGKFYLVEVAARGGGTKLSSHIVPAVSGAPTNEWLIACALGEPFNCAPPSSSATPFAVLNFFNFEHGCVATINGVDELRATPGILDVGMNVCVGTDIRPPTDDVARHGYFIAKAGSRSELDALIDHARALVTLTYA